MSREITPCAVDKSFSVTEQNPASCVTDCVTELETLWRLARENSYELHSASFAVEKAETEYKKHLSLYPFSLKLGTDSSFNDVYEKVEWFPGSAKVNVSFSKVNPFGNTVSGSVSYGLCRSVLDFFTETVEPENIGYSHSPEINLQISQSLFPAFTGTGGKIINPQIKILKNSVETALYSKQEAELALFQAVAELYVQARCVLREIEKYSEYVDFYEKKIAAAEELLLRGKISASDMWSLESKKWEFCKNYLDAVGSRENIFLQLKNFCGMCEVDEKSFLPDEKDFLFESDSKKKITLLEMENLTLQNNLLKQNSAPSLVLGGTVSEQTKAHKGFLTNYIEDKSVFAWNFSLSLSFSEFLSPTRRMKELFYRKNLDLYREKLKFLDEETENRRNNLCKIVELYEKQAVEMESVKRKREKLYSDYKTLFQQEKCSVLDVDEVHLSVTEAECVSASLRDNLWFYKWMEVQYK